MRVLPISQKEYFDGIPHFCKGDPRACSSFVDRRGDNGHYWLFFTIVLFVLEPFFLHKLFRKYAEKDPGKAFKIMHRAHWVLLILSLITIFGAVAGGHGWYLF